VVADIDLQPHAADRVAGPAPDRLDRPGLDASQMLDVSDTALSASDRDGVLVSMSGAITHITGFSPQDYVGTRLIDHIHPDDVESTVEQYRHLRFGTDGTRVGFRVRAKTSTGDWRWVEIVVTRQLDRRDVHALVASVRDAEDEQLEAQRRQEAEEVSRRQLVSMEQHEAFLQAVIAVSADAVVIADGDLTMRWASPSTESFSGWTSEALVGRNALELVHPEEQPLAVAEIAPLLGPERGVAQPLNCRILMSGGDYRWMRVTGKDMRDVPWVRGVVLCLSDTHEATLARLALDASQRRFGSLVRNSHDGIAVTDAEGSCVYVSPAATRMLGWAPEEVCGTPFATGIGEPDHSRAAEAFARAVADPSQPQLLHLQVPHRDGDLRWIEVALWSRLDDPDVQGLVANFRDVTEHRRLVAELEERSEVLRSLAFSSSTGLFEQDSLNGLTYVNERFVEIVGLSAAECLGDGWRRLLDGPELEGVTALADARAGNESTVRVQFTRPDGQRRWLDLRSTVTPPDAEGVRRRFGGIEDVTAIVEAEESLRRLAEVFDITDDLVLLLDAAGQPIYLNQAAKDFVGDDPSYLADHPDLHEVSRAVRASFRAPGVNLWSGEATLESCAGTTVPMSLKAMAHRHADGSVQYVSVVARDISERIELEAILEREATHDPLTGLPNRALLLDRIRKALEHRREADRAALLFVDLDHFKVINDSLGHALGDQLLRAIAARILVVIRPGDTVARFGGDEFVVLCEELDDDDDALRVAHRIETSLQTPFDVDGHEIHVGVSIGIAFADHTEPDPVAILRDADTAMYEAKSAGRGRWVVFDDNLRTRAVDRQRTEAELRQSRNGDNLRIHYQPVMDLRTGTIRGVEALLRWWRNGELVGPEHFVSVAEETGLIVPLGTWALEQACEQAARWQRELPGWADLGMAVNVSARQLQRPGFLSMVSEVISSSGIREGTLTIEITESVLLDDTAATAALLSALRDMGVHVAVDDFGTGYSSLTYLHRLPVDAVKLDRSFVAGVADDMQKRAIVTAVLHLTKALGLQSIAEGIETERQLAELRLLGCIAGQGYLISPAVDDETITSMLRDGFAM
jgi:diguanylate cyclase (GGDEF)-like protein/PAS domain S-box-containing protein